MATAKINSGTQTNKKILIKTIVIVFLCLCLLSLLSFWIYEKNKPYLLYKKTRFHNMMSIEEGFLAFNTKYERLPKSLEEVVASDLLPEKSEIYSCPILKNSIFGEKLTYHECQYDFVFNEHEIFIQMPESVLKMEDYKDLTEFGRRIEIYKGTTLLIEEYVPPD